MSNIADLKSSLVKAWRDLKNEKLDADIRKAAYADIITISEQVSKLDSNFGMSTEMLEKYKTFASKQVVPRVIWPKHDTNSQFEELETQFDKIIALAVKIVHKRLPREPQDSDKFGTIVNATTSHLIRLCSTPSATLI